MTDLQPNITAIYRYPVKGMTGERLSEVQLETGKTLPFDRAFAFENGDGKFDPDYPRHLPKTNFLMLMRNEKLAGLNASFDDNSQMLTLQQGGKVVARGRLDKAEERLIIEDFINHYMNEGELRGRAHIVQAADHSFSDVSAKCLHIINLASVRALQQVMDTTLDPLRFRANIYLGGLDAWEEFGWMNQDIAFGDARLHVFQRTVRCLATNVDPKTAIRDETNIPIILKKNFGHSDMGIYATVTKPGLVTSPAE